MKLPEFNISSDKSARFFIFPNIFTNFHGFPKFGEEGTVILLPLSRTPMVHSADGAGHFVTLLQRSILKRIFP